MSNTPEEFPDMLVLAAVDRAVRHGDHEARPVLTVMVMQHLDLPMRSTRARHAKTKLAILEAAGSLERSRRHGLEAWQLAAAGRRRLRRAEREGRVDLPESPQHRSWRNARATASHEIERARREFREHLDQAVRLLDREQSSSDAWFEVGERLAGSAWLVGSMTHCLHEWSEPNDTHPDHDEHTAPSDERLTPDEQVRVCARRRGRRNAGLWLR